MKLPTLKLHFTQEIVMLWLCVAKEEEGRKKCSDYTSLDTLYIKRVIVYLKMYSICKRTGCEKIGGGLVVDETFPAHWLLCRIIKTRPQ
jgi:hypothetical protein